MVNGDLTRYPEVGCPWGARTGEPRAKAGARYCEPGWGPTIYTSIKTVFKIYASERESSNIHI